MFHIPINDCWWDDLAPPITREELLDKPEYLRIYDAVVANTDKSKPTVTIIQQHKTAEETVIHKYIIHGNYDPVLIYRNDIVRREYVHGEHIVTYRHIIHARAITRRKVKHIWNNNYFYQLSIYCPTVHDEQAEIRRRDKSLENDYA